jgi:predicted phosphodiesterase
MLIDVLSDLHINSYFKELNPSENKIKIFWENLNPKGEILIIAGDIGEIIQQNVKFLSTLKKLFYKEIICVFGNHDLHCLTDRIIYMYDENKELIEQKTYKSYQDKIEESKKLYKENSIHLLDGEIINIEGINIGGAMGWYDGKYTEIHNISLGNHWLDQYRSFSDLNELWNACMPDNDIKTLKSFDSLFKVEYEKLNKIIKDCDIIISHINPSLQKEHQNPFFKESPSTSFYCFDGEDLMRNFKGKFWFFGHSHFNSNYLIKNKDNNFNLLSNTLGYPDENKRIYNKIITIKI